MRYFKYSKIKTTKNNALKEHYLSLTKDEKNTFRRKKFWLKISAIIIAISFFSCIAVSIYLLTLISKPSGGWEILYYIGIVLISFVLFIASAFLAYGITVPFLKKADRYNVPVMKKEILSKACAHLREYYQLQEPYIVTKCYKSTDERFTNHDVCIFVVGDELRITTDIIHGFLHGKRDLGCYAFKKNDIRLSKKNEENLLVAELEAKDTTFRLGYRAKSFIEKFLNN